MKYVLIFNGYPKSGKTTFEKGIAEKVPSIIHSSIDPVKHFVHNIFLYKIDDAILLDHINKFGLGDKEKTQEYRLLLSDTKKLLDDFCEYSLKYQMRLVNQFMSEGLNDVSLLMIDIREPHNISKFVNEFRKSSYYKNKKCNIATVFMKNKRAEDIYYCNDSDNNVEKYPYDFKINNNGTLKNLCDDAIPEFIDFLKMNWDGFQKGYVH